MSFESCSQCGAPAENKCARCQSVVYCNRECQKVHWTKHKITCSDAKGQELKKVRWLMCTNSRISGNLFIMASHRYATSGLGVVFAEIDETIDEYMKGNSMHFAHISFAPLDTYREFAASKYSLQITAQLPEFDTASVIVVYILKDFHQVMKITPENTIDMTSLKNTYPSPDNDWSVLFTL